MSHHINTLPAESARTHAFFNQSVNNDSGPLGKCRNTQLLTDELLNSDSTFSGKAPPSYLACRINGTAYQARKIKSACDSSVCEVTLMLGSIRKFCSLNICGKLIYLLFCNEKLVFHTGIYSSALVTYMHATIPGIDMSIYT